MKLWVGLAGLKPNKKSKNFKRFGKGKGAYVHVAAWADSRETFADRVKRAAEELDCVLYDLDDVSLLETRMKTPEYPDEFLNMYKTAQGHPQDAVFGDFHVWHQDDSN